MSGPATLNGISLTGSSNGSVTVSCPVCGRNKSYANSDGSRMSIGRATMLHAIINHADFTET